MAAANRMSCGGRPGFDKGVAAVRVLSRVLIGYDKWPTENDNHNAPIAAGSIRILIL